MNKNAPEDNETTEQPQRKEKSIACEHWPRLIHRFKTDVGTFQHRSTRTHANTSRLLSQPRPREAPPGG